MSAENLLKKIKIIKTTLVGQLSQRMSEAQFEELLKVKPLIEKQDTVMSERISTPARIKLQIVPRYLATGNCFGILEFKLKFYFTSQDVQFLYL